MKKRALFISAVAALVLAAVAFETLRPRQYYRYGGGKVWLVSDKSACWNGLLRGPCLEFGVPRFLDARSWKPRAADIRRALQDYPDLDEKQVAQIIRACVSCQEAETAKSEP